MKAGGRGHSFGRWFDTGKVSDGYTYTGSSGERCRGFGDWSATASSSEYSSHSPAMPASRTKATPPDADGESRIHMDQIPSSGTNRTKSLCSIEFWTASMIFRARFPTPAP